MKEQKSIKIERSYEKREVNGKAILIMRKIETIQIITEEIVENSSVIIEHKDDTQHNYYTNNKGELHKEDAPAFEYSDGTKFWYYNGKRHRENGPAIENSNGTQAWYKHGLLHRADGYAVKHPDGTKEWNFQGELHREDGPAIEYASGCKEWWIEGIQYTEEEFNNYLEKKKLKKSLNQKLNIRDSKLKVKI